MSRYIDENGTDKGPAVHEYHEQTGRIWTRLRRVDTYYIDNVIFDDDPDLSQRLSPEATQGRCDSGLTYPQKNESI